MKAFAHVVLLLALFSSFAVGQSYDWPITGGGSGDVVGPAAANDNRVARFDSTTGKLLQNSAVTIDDSGNMSGVGTLGVGGDVSGVGGLSMSGNISGAVNITMSGDLTTGLTASRALATDGSSVVGVSATTATELGYLSGVTSAVQTQIDGKEDTISLTASRAVVSDVSGALEAAATTATEIGYVSGVTSAIQTQIDGKEDTISLTASRAVVSGAGGALEAATTTATEIGYVNGVTSAIQTQIDGKQASDDDLTAVAGLSSNGIVARTGAGTAAVRTISAGSSKVSVTNGDGVAGNPSIDVTEANMTLDSIGGTLGISKGGTGQTSASAAFDALSPMTTQGDIIVGGTSGAATRLAAVTDNRVVAGDGTNVVSKQIDDPGFFASGAEVTQSSPGVVLSAGQLKGTNTNDDASAGYVGEYPTHSVDNTGTTWAPASNVTGNAGSIAVTAGDWDVSFLARANGGTFTGGACWVTETSASSTGRELGANYATTPNTTNATMSMANYRMTFTGSATIYLVCTFTYSSAPTIYHRLSARRVR